MTTPQPVIQLLEEDIKKLFSPGPKKPNFWDLIWALFKSTVWFGILFVFFFIVINFPAFSIKANFYIKTVILGQEIDNKTTRPLKILQPLARSSEVDLNSNADTSTGQSVEEFLKSNIKNNYLIIPSIGVSAPVIWDSPINNIINDLKNGLAHYAGTAKPGENGNVFITGHSSNYWWDTGQFKQIFALLDKIKLEDRIYINYNNQPYVYLVESIKVVKPSQIEVLNPSDHSIVTLMTCTPVGTTVNRLIVQAKQIYPKTNNIKTLPINISPTELPPVR